MLWSVPTWIWRTFGGSFLSQVQFAQCWRKVCDSGYGGTADDSQLVWISDQIHAVYSKSIEITVDSANAVSDNLFGETTEEAEEESTDIDKAKELLSDVTGSVAKVIEQFKNVLNRFIEAIAVMIVTTCLIPILVIVFFVWIVKTLFNVPIVVPTQLINPKKAKHSIRDKSSGADRLPHEEKKELPEFVNN